MSHSSNSTIINQPNPLKNNGKVLPLAMSRNRNPTLPPSKSTAHILINTPFAALGCSPLCPSSPVDSAFLSFVAGRVSFEECMLMSFVVFVVDIDWISCLMLDAAGGQSARCPGCSAIAVFPWLPLDSESAHIAPKTQNRIIRIRASTWGCDCLQLLVVH